MWVLVDPPHADVCTLHHPQLQFGVDLHFAVTAPAASALDISAPEVAATVTTEVDEAATVTTEVDEAATVTTEVDEAAIPIAGVEPAPGPVFPMEAETGSTPVVDEGMELFGASSVPSNC